MPSMSAVNSAKPYGMPVYLLNFKLSITAQSIQYYRLTLIHKEETHTVTAISVGGGMIEWIELDGCAVSMAGDTNEYLIFLKENASEIVEFLKQRVDPNQISVLRNPGTQILELKSPEVLADGLLVELKDSSISICRYCSILPVLSRQISAAFITCDEMKKYIEERKLN